LSHRLAYLDRDRPVDSPYIKNPNPYIKNPNPYFRNPAPYIRNPNPYFKNRGLLENRTHVAFRVPFAA